MRLGTPGFVGKRLVEAREARELTGVALANLLGLSSTTITLYEQGRATPSPEGMEALSRCLNLPTSYFLRAPFPEDEANIFWRSAAASTKAARARAERRLTWIKECCAYLREFFDFPSVNLPIVNGISNFKVITGDQIEDIANECRKFWGLSSGPIPDALSEIECNGIIASRIQIDAEKLDAFSQWSDQDGTPYIVLGSDKASAVRSRFDASHELAHLLIHRRVDKKRINDSADFKLMEEQAHRFAAAFLLPAASFSREVWAPSLDTFLALKRRWGVSIQAMIMRCRHLNIINEDQEKRMWINLNRRGWKKDEPLDDSIEPEVPKLLRRSIEMLVSENVRRADHIISELHLASSDIEELTALPPGFLRGQSATVSPFPKLRSNRKSGGGDVISLEEVRRKKS